MTAAPLGPLFTNPYVMVENAAGVPYPRALLNFYLTGSTQREATYTDPGLTTPNANPVEADAGGTFPLIYLDPAVVYKAVLTDSLGTEIWTADPVLQAWSGRLNIITPSGGDDTAIIAAASALGPIVLAGGNFIISGVLTCPGYVEMLSNAVLTTPSAASVAFNDGFSAPVGLAFGPNVTVTFDPRFFSTGYPEWWGAVTNDTSVDCSVGLNACFTACPISELRAAQYFTQNTCTVANHNKTIRGVSLNITLRNNSTEICTQIVIQSATADCMFVGYNSSPGGDGSFLRAFEMTNVALNRSVPPTPPTTVGFTGAGPFAGPAGLRMQYVINAHLTGVITNEHYYGVYLFAAVACYFDTCSADRLAAGSTPTNDGFAGWFLDASAPGVGVDGIASLYMNRCAAFNTFGLFGPTAFSHAIYTYDGFTDLFITQFEGTSTVNGMTFNAAASGDSEDLHVANCVLDSMTNIGIAINGNGTNPCVFDISMVYVANNSGYAGAIGYAVNNMPGGHGEFRGGQLVGNTGTSMIGLSITNSGGVSLNGTLMTEVKRPVVAVGAFGGKWSFNATCNFTTGQDAVHVTTTTRVIIEPELNITGGVPPWVNGVNIADAGSGYNRVEVTGINPAACSANKLINNGTPITSETAIGGQFGTQNIARGVFA